MRTFLTLLLLCSTMLGADRPRGFLGINWGASPEEAKRIMQARHGVKFPDDTDDYRFELTGGVFAEQPVAKWILEFPERKFASATVVIKTEGNASTLYKEFRTQLVSKYGSATSNQKLSNKAAKQAGAPRPPSGGTVSLWKFAPNLREQSTVTIGCELAGPAGQPTTDESQLQLSIRYTNETLTAAAATNTTAGEKTAQAPVKKDDL